MTKEELKELKAACARCVKACSGPAGAYKRYLDKSGALQRYHNEAEKIGPAF